MNILVIGTGNIGTLYGWALAEAGHQVTHLVRPGTRRADVAEIDVLDERAGKAVRRRLSYPWSVVDRPPATADLVLVATPAADVADALAPLAARYPEATFLVWALTWDPISFDPALADRLLLGYPDSGGTREGARYVLGLGAEPHLGLRGSQPVPGLMSERAPTADRSRWTDTTRLFDGAGFHPVVHDPMEPWLWVHVANTVPYWVALAQHRDLTGLTRDRRLLRTAFRASREILDVVAAGGVDLDAHDEAGTALHTPAWLFPFAFRLLYRTNEGMRRAAAHGVAGIDEGIELATQVLRTADRLGVAMPELSALMAAARVETMAPAR